MLLQLNNDNCKINFKDMIVSENPPSLEEALLNTTPFEIGDEAAKGNTQIVVDVNEEMLKHVR